MMYTKIVCVWLACTSCCYAATSDDYRQEFARNPDDYQALYNAGVAAFKENNLERAQECFDLVKAADAQKPWNAQQGEQIFYNAGNTEMKLKKYEPAVSSFEKVLTYNPHNELARKKLELAKKLLEQQEQQQDKHNDKQNDDKKDQDNQDQDKKDNDTKQDKSQDQNKDTTDNDSQQKDNQKDQQKQEEKSQDKDSSDNTQQQDHNKNNDKKSGNDKDKQSQNQEKNNKEQQQQSGQDKEEQAQPQQDKADGEKQKKPEPELTQQEKKILAYVQTMDEKMHDALNEKTLKKAQGVVRDYHNW